MNLTSCFHYNIVYFLRQLFLADLREGFKDDFVKILLTANRQIMKEMLI